MSLMSYNVLAFKTANLNDKNQLIGVKVCDKNRLQIKIERPSERERIGRKKRVHLKSLNIPLTRLIYSNLIERSCTQSII